MTTLAQIGDRDRAYLTVQRDQQRVFRVAMRHSRWVRVLRLAIPVAVGIGLAGTLAGFILFDPWGELQRRPSTSGPVVSGTKIAMRQARVGGFTKDKRPYTVTARVAEQDVNNPDVLEMEDIRVVMTTQTQGDVEVVARNGVYDGKSDKLALKHNIVVKSPSYVARLSEALVGVKAGSVVSEHPVEVDMLEGTIQSNRLEVIDSGAVLIFDNGVTMVIDKEGNNNASKSAGAR